SPSACNAATTWLLAASCAARETISQAPQRADEETIAHRETRSHLQRAVAAMSGYRVSVLQRRGCECRISFHERRECVFVFLRQHGARHVNYTPAYLHQRRSER